MAKVKTDAKYILEMVESFQKLPEFGMMSKIDEIKRQYEEMVKAEQKLAAEKKAFYDKVENLRKVVLANWMDTEVMEATGYRI